jgi:hypothetical protein
MLRIALLGASLALLLCLGSASAATSARACKAFTFKDNGVPWSAKQIRVKGSSCKSARGLIRSYARPRNCRLQAPCHIKHYVCKTTNSHDSTFTETCKRPGRSVRWRGSYSSS